MCRRLGFALLFGVLVLAFLPEPASAYDFSSPFNVMRNSFSSFQNQAVRGINSFVDNVQNTTSHAVQNIVRFAAVKSTKDEVCYRILGCFSLQSPWISLNRPLPAPKAPEDMKVRYYLHTRTSPERFAIESAPPLSLNGSNFDGAKTTFFLVHGYLNSGDAAWMSDLKDAILSKVDGNVFIVDWSGGALDPSYLQAASNTRVVGREIAWLATTLINQYGASAKRMHFLGHSLGSHISGYAARNITNVARITALDPAGPGFEALPRLVRLNKNAADFVDALHTNAKPITALGFGMMHPIAHVDFYVNGGVEQPGCLSPSVEINSLLDLVTFPAMATFDLVACSHTRAYVYITEAIKNTDCRMWGHKVGVARQRLRWKNGISSAVPAKTGKCVDAQCVPIGLDTPQYPARGTFSVTTGSSGPFCLQENSNDGETLDELKNKGYLN